MMKIYVASSWRNPYQHGIVSMLRSLGYEVYDFRNPKEGEHGFAWSQIDPHWGEWDKRAYRLALLDPIAEKGFKNDFDAMNAADVCVLLLPSGRSAHTEAGWMAGKGKPVFALMIEDQEPELMYKIFDKICLNADELIDALNKYDQNVLHAPRS